MADATRLSHLPPTAVMFAALLGYNPIQMLLGPVDPSGYPERTVASLDPATRS